MFQNRVWEIIQKSMVVYLISNVTVKGMVEWGK